VPRITDFCICVYVFGCKLSLIRLCGSDFLITPVDDITVGIICAAFSFHIAHISFASSWYLFCLSVIIIIIIIETVGVLVPNRNFRDFSLFNLQTPFILYIGQTYRFSPQYSFYIFNQQIYLFFLDFLSPYSFIPPQNVLYLLMLPFLVHKIFTFYINGVLNCKCPASGPKG
jgi:hypothetical protein